MNALYRSLATTYLSAKKRRTLMTITGIALGVTMVVAVAVTGSALIANYREVLQGAGGRADIQVSSIGGLGFPQSLLGEVADVTGVAAAVPAVTSGAPVMAGDRKTTAQVYGIDPRQDPRIRDYRFLDGSLPGAGKEIAITSDLAGRLGVATGGSIRVLSTTGFQDFTVTGVFRSDSTGRGALGPFAVMPLAEAQQMFGRSGRLDTIDVLVAAGARKESVQSAIAQRLAGRARAGTPVERARDMDKLLQSIIFSLSLAGAISLFAGAFIIYTNVGMGVAERRRDLSVLRALGMRRGEVMRLVLGEAAAMGVAGALLGLVLGYALSAAMVAQLTRQFLEIYGITATSVALSPMNVVTALVVGLGVATFAAYGPAHETVRISPIEAMRDGETSRSAPEQHGARRALAGLAISLAAIAAIAVTWHTLDLSDPRVMRLGGALMMAVLFGAVVFMPAALPWLNRALLRPVEERLFGVSGRIATDNLERQPRRTAATASALMVSLTFMVAMGAFAASQRSTIDDWFKRTVNWDLAVSSSYSLIGAQVEIDPKLVQELATVPGVRVASAERFGPVVLGDGNPAYLQVMDHTVLRQFASPPMDAGNWEEASAAMTRGGAVLLSSPLARRLGAGIGDMVTIPTPSGPREFRVAGLMKELAPFGGTLQLDARDYTAYWHDPNASVVIVLLEQGADAEQVRRAILDRWGATLNLTVQTRQEFWQDMLGRINSFYRLMDGLIWIAVLVSGLAIANTLFSGLLERKREFGILRAIGARRGETMRMVVSEALSTGALGGIFGLLGGAGMFYLMVSASEDVSGTAVDAVFPWVAVGTALFVALLAAPAIGLLPARWAARLDIVDALRYE